MCYYSHKKGSLLLLENIKNDLIGKFRIVAFLEGLSYITLLFIAMPLKYLYAMPIAVKIVGMTHGILFIAFLIYLLLCAQRHNFTKKDTFVFFIASLIPFGTFFTDKRLKEYEEQL